jgi:dipeptidase D
VDIHENRGNAIKIAVRTLLAGLEKELELDLISIDGGSKHNAIPREAFAVFRLPGASVGVMREIIDAQVAGFKEELGTMDPDLEIVLEQLEDDGTVEKPMNIHARDRLLHALNGIPHGVLAMSREVPGLVETSNNLAVVATEETRAVLTTSHRSSVMPSLFAVQSQVRSICVLAGATVEIHDAYPGWKPNPDSPIVRTMVEVYREKFGKEPDLKAIHAGLECGLLLEKVPDMDIVSIGPEIRNPHSPDERVQISSVQRFYEAVKGVLAKVAESA